MKLRKCSAPPDLDTIDDSSTDSEWESSDEKGLDDIPEEPEDEHEGTDNIIDDGHAYCGSDNAGICESDAAGSKDKDERVPCRSDIQADAPGGEDAQHIT